MLPLTGVSGETRTVLTDPYGYYSFYEVRTGETYVFSVSHKKYEFAARTVTVIDGLTDLNFIAEDTTGVNMPNSEVSKESNK